jgi:hypothetical protein
VVVIPTGGDEDGLVAVARLLFESKNVTPETECALDIRDLEMDVTNIHPRIDRPTRHAISLVKRKGSDPGYSSRASSSGFE